MFFPKNLVFRNAIGGIEKLRYYFEEHPEEGIQNGELLVLRQNGHTALVTYFDNLEDIGSVWGNLPQMFDVVNPLWDYQDTSGIIYTSQDRWQVKEPFPFDLNLSSIGDFKDVNIEGVEVGDGLEWVGEDLETGYFVVRPGFGGDDFDGNYPLELLNDVEITEPVQDQSALIYDVFSLKWVNQFEEKTLENRGDTDFVTADLQDKDALTYDADKDTWGTKAVQTEGVIKVPDGRRGRRADLEYFILPGVKSSLGQDPDGTITVRAEPTEIFPYGADFYVKFEDIGRFEIRDEEDTNYWSRFPDGAFYFRNLQRFDYTASLSWHQFFDSEAGSQWPQVPKSKIHPPLTYVGEGRYANTKKGWMDLNRRYAGSFTIQFWFRMDLAGIEWYNPFLGQDEYAILMSNPSSYQLYFKGSFRDGYSLWFRTSVTDEFKILDDVKELKDYHFAFTHDDVTGRLYVYIDGQLLFIKESNLNAPVIAQTVFGNKLNGYIADIAVTLCNEFPNTTSFRPAVGWGRRKIQAPRAAIKTLGVTDKGRFGFVTRNQPLTWQSVAASGLNGSFGESLDIDYDTVNGDDILVWDEASGKFVGQEPPMALPGTVTGSDLPMKTLAERYEASGLEGEFFHMVFNPKHQGQGYGKQNYTMTAFMDVKPIGSPFRNTGPFQLQGSPETNVIYVDHFLAGRSGVVFDERYPEGAFVRMPAKFSDNGISWTEAAEEDLRPNGRGIALGQVSRPWKGVAFSVRLDLRGISYGTGSVLSTSIGFVFRNFQLNIDQSTFTLVFAPEFGPEFTKIGSVSVELSLESLLPDHEKAYDVSFVYDINTGYHIFVDGLRVSSDQWTATASGSLGDVNQNDRYITLPEAWHELDPERINPGLLSGIMGWGLHAAIPEGWHPDIGYYDFSVLYDVTKQLPGIATLSGDVVSAVEGRQETSIQASLKSDRTVAIAGEKISVDREALRANQNFFNETRAGRLYAQPGFRGGLSYQVDTSFDNIYVSRIANNSNYYRDVVSPRALNENSQMLVYRADIKKWIPEFVTNSNVNWEVNVNESLTPADGELMKWNAKFGVWYTGESTGQVLIGLEDLSDVEVEDPKSNDYLYYDEIGNVWRNAPQKDKGSLDRLADVQTGGAYGYDLLKWDSTLRRWVNKPAAESSLSLFDMEDVVEGPNYNRSGGLVFENGQWVAKELDRGGDDDLAGFFETYRWLDFKAVRTLNNAFVTGEPPVRTQVDGERLLDERGNWVGNALGGSWVVWEDAPAPAVTPSGDGGNFEFKETMAGLPLGFYGGGNWELGTVDEPVELIAGMDGGEFTETSGAYVPMPKNGGQIVVALPYVIDEGRPEDGMLYDDTGRVWGYDSARGMLSPRRTSVGPGVMQNLPYVLDGYPRVENNVIDGSGSFFTTFNDGERCGAYTDETPETELYDSDFTIEAMFELQRIDASTRQTYQWLVGASCEEDLQVMDNNRSWALKLAGGGLKQSIEDDFADSYLFDQNAVIFEFWDEDNIKHEVIANFGSRGFKNGAVYDAYTKTAGMVPNEDDFPWTSLEVQRSVSRSSFSFYCNGRKIEMFDPAFGKPIRRVSGLTSPRLGVGTEPTPNLPQFENLVGYVYSLRIIKGEVLRGNQSEEYHTGNYGIVNARTES